MKTILLIIIIAITASASIETNQAHADCNANVDYSLILEESELVFTGTVTRLDNYDGPQKVTFFIHDKIKGEIDTPKHILENSGKIFLEDGSTRGSSVSVDYKIGKTYKVYVENGDTSQCTTKITTPADYMWEPGPEDGNYYSANPVWADPCDDGYGLSDGVCITIEEMNRNAPPHLEPNQDPKEAPHTEPEPEPEQDIPIYDDCGPGTILQDGICVVTSESKSTETNGKWGNPFFHKLPAPNLEPRPDPDLSASCAFDGAIAMWFYQFIVNPLCAVGIQIIPDYECNCGF